jgi:hypothetical protein
VISTPLGCGEREAAPHKKLSPGHSGHDILALLRTCQPLQSETCAAFGIQPGGLPRGTGSSVGLAHRLRVRLVSAFTGPIQSRLVRSTGGSGCTIQELAGLVWNKCTTIFKSDRACCSYEMWYDCKWLECSRPMAVSASPAARAVRTACFAEQMEQKKQLLPASSQRSYPPALHPLGLPRSDWRVGVLCV